MPGCGGGEPSRGELRSEMRSVSTPARPSRDAFVACRALIDESGPGPDLETRARARGPHWVGWQDVRQRAPSRVNSISPGQSQSRSSACFTRRRLWEAGHAAPKRREQRLQRVFPGERARLLRDVPRA